MAPQAHWIHSFVTDDKISTVCTSPATPEPPASTSATADFPQTMSRSSER